MYTNQRRTQPEVLKEILSISPGKLSHIRFAVGMSHSQARRYVPFLVKDGYLEDRPDERGAIVYHITERGKRLLELLNQLSDFFETPATLGDLDPAGLGEQGQPQR